MSDTLEAPKTEPGKGLAIIADLTPEIFTAEKAQEIVTSLRAEVLTIDRDVSTKKGREAIASMAAKIARSKTAADAFGKNLKAEYKAKVDAIDGIRRIFWDGLVALQKEFRQPLTEFEEREKARVAGHEAALADIARLPFFDGTPPTDAIADRLTIAQAVDVSTFEEFTARAEAAKADAVAKLEAMLAESRKRDEERAAKAEADRLAAIEQAKRDAEAAVEQERQRAEAQQRAEEEETRKREQDKAHRGRVNSAAMRAIITAMADAHSGNAAEAEVIARAIVTAIARGAVPAIKIAY